MLTREEVLDRLLPELGDGLIVAGLGNPVHELARRTGDADYFFPLDGVMGAAVSMGLGLALARPDKDVLVVTGDGELLMNLGALATVAVQAPPRLSILCMDNGVYGLTGGQATHTAAGVDLAGVARAAGLAGVETVESPEDLDRGRAELLNRHRTSFVLAKVDPGNAPAVPVERDAAVCRTRFRTALLTSAPPTATEDAR